jgi:hypothetical protein
MHAFFKTLRVTLAVLTEFVIRDGRTTANEAFIYFSGHF